MPEIAVAWGALRFSDDPGALRQHFYLLPVEFLAPLYSVIVEDTFQTKTIVVSVLSACRMLVNSNSTVVPGEFVPSNIMQPVLASVVLVMSVTYHDHD